MNKRLLLALALSAAVIGLTQYFFPPATPKPVAKVAAPAGGAGALAPGAATGGTTLGTTVGPAAIADSAAVTGIDTTTITGRTATWRLSSVGAAPVSVQLAGYKALDERGKTDRPVELVRAGERLMSWQLVLREATGNRTIDLSRVPFATTRVDDRTVRYAATVGALNVAITYTFVPDSFLARVGGQVTGLTTPAVLQFALPSGLASAEADTLEDQRQLAVAAKPTRENATSVAYGKLDPGEKQLVEGPLTWVASKSKFFVAGFLTMEGDRPFDEAEVTGGPLVGKVESHVNAVVRQRLENGQFRFELYAGPQEWRRLVALGRDFEHSNPYGGWLQGFVQPFARIVMRALLWMHESLRLEYGWVLVIFGITVRLLLWPFNQKAMRSSMKMQAIQPELQAVQDKHKADPQKMQAEVMRVYKEHGMSPFSALSGCLPMLIPMPVFITLFFVFQNTIEFRGVPFLYLNDISQRDHTFIIPILMAASAYALSWIGMRGMPPNPQAKMMGYVFPAMMFVFFWSAAAGLNLYYMVQNIAALPQQWLIARERQKNPKPGAAAAATVMAANGRPAQPKKR
ncbi:MAG: membrane protein insertase YidC [Gemmatimonadaceae bacterium]|nr:membrane protein insertase YidC [Gemmatimonadaceae bacterium]